MPDILSILKHYIFWSSPIIFIFGILLLFYSNYKRLEEYLNRQIINSKFTVPVLDDSIYGFHKWLMEKRTIVAIICIAYSVIIFFLFSAKLFFLN